MRAIAVTTTHSREEMSEAMLILPLLASLTVRMHVHDDVECVQLEVRT
jgi:hypothetical protein